MELEVLRGGEAIVVAVALEQHADLVAHARARRAGQAWHAHLAAVGPHEAEEHAQRRGLAGAVGAEVPEDRPWLDREGEPVEARRRTEALGDVAEVEGGRGVLHRDPGLAGFAGPLRAGRGGRSSSGKSLSSKAKVASVFMAPETARRMRRSFTPRWCGPAAGHGASSFPMPVHATPRAYLVVSIDCECDKGRAWRCQRPLSFSGIQRGIAERLEPLFRRHRAKATYLLSPEVLRDEASVTCLRAVARNAELGTHLHGEHAEPFAFEPEVTAAFQRDYAPEVERAKLASLTELFVAAFGARPRSFRAGRFGIGESTLGALEAQLRVRGRVERDPLRGLVGQGARPVVRDGADAALPSRSAAP